MLNILSILLLVFLLIDIYITVKRNEETMETKDTKELITINTTDLVISIRAIEYLITSAKESERYMHGSILKTNRVLVKEAKATLKKLKAIYNKETKRGIK